MKLREHRPRHEQSPQTVQRARSVAPGKRTLTMSLPSRRPSEAAPLQRRPAMPPSSAPRSRAAEGPVEDWMAVALRPDLHQAPILRKSADQIGYAAADAPTLSVASSGQAMPAAVQAKMEGAFGADFSAVRIHQGPEAQAMGALAYTQGSSIHFAPGQYDPGSQRGQELLGHELAHVVQQAQGRVSATTQAKGVGINDDASLEREADQMGARAARGEPAGPRAGTALALPASGSVQMSAGETIRRIAVALGVATAVAATIYMAVPASIAMLIAGGGLAGIGEYWSGLVSGIIGRGARGTQEPQDNGPRETPGSGLGALPGTTDSPRDLDEARDENEGKDTVVPGRTSDEVAHSPGSTLDGAPGMGERQGRPGHGQVDRKATREPEIPEALITSRDNLIGGRVHFVRDGQAFCHYEVHGFTLSRSLNARFEPRAIEFRDLLAQIEINGVHDEPTVRETAITMILDGSVDDAIGMLQIYAGELPARELQDDVHLEREELSSDEPGTQPKQPLEELTAKRVPAPDPEPEMDLVSEVDPELEQARARLERELSRRTERYRDLSGRAGAFRDLQRDKQRLDGQWGWLRGATTTSSDVTVRENELRRLDERMDALALTLVPLEQKKEEERRAAEEKQRREIEEKNRRDKEERKEQRREAETYRYSITRKQAEDFVRANPPPPNVTNAWTYLAMVSGDDLYALGFGSREGDYELLAEVLQSHGDEQKRIIKERKDRFNPNDDTTWDKVQEIRFVGVTQGEITQARDGERILEEIRQCRQVGNGKNHSTVFTAGQPLHTHLSLGSWGLAFIYVQEDDGRVRPVVFDIARGRTDGNEYKWHRGGTSYNSNASYK